MQGRLAYAYPTIDMLREQIELGLTVADEISFSEADIRSDFEPNPYYDPSQPTRRVTADDPAWPENSGDYAHIGSDNGNTFDVHNSPVYRNPAWGQGSLSPLATSPEIMTKQADFAADLMDLLLEYHDKIVAVAWDGSSDGVTFNRTTGCNMWDSTNNEKYSFFAIIGAPNRYKMREAIAAGPAASEEAKYTAASWAPYAAALEAAEDLVDVRIYDLDGVNAVKAATSALEEATAALERLPHDVLCPSSQFTDVPPVDNWAHASIDYCVENDLMQGISDTAFLPKGVTTRAQFVTILYRIAGEPEVEFKGIFEDVAEGKFYSAAVEWAAANGIVNGVSETAFDPEGSITREQIVAILYRYAGSPNVEGELAYRDAFRVSGYARNAMLWAVNEGIINGVADPHKPTMLEPQSFAIREQIATIIMRFLEK